MDTPADRKDASNDIDAILSKIEKTVGPLSSPNYGRAKLNTQRYARFIKQLSYKFWVRDTSDDNEDLASVLELRLISSGEDYILYLSKVADFAFAMKLKDFTSNTDSAIFCINKIVESLGLLMLDRSILATPVNALTFYASQPKLFNILFSDMDFLPWQSSGATRD